jgi:hypothetical protein
LKAAVQQAPAQVNVDWADGNGKGVRAFVEQRFAITLARSTGVASLHRLGFVLNRPTKRFLKADAAQREQCVRRYALGRAPAERIGAQLFFADEAHCRADADLRGKWVLRGEPALGDSTSPRWGEKASYYSAVCVETGEVERWERTGHSTAATSVPFLAHRRACHPEPL